MRTVFFVTRWTIVPEESVMIGPYDDRVSAWDYITETRANASPENNANTNYGVVGPFEFESELTGD